MSYWDNLLKLKVEKADYSENHFKMSYWLKLLKLLDENTDYSDSGFKRSLLDSSWLNETIKKGRFRLTNGLLIR